MTAEDDDFRSVLLIKVTADKIETEQICAILRGLLFSQGQSDGQTKKNKDYKSGCRVNFGAHFTMKDFMAQVRTHLSDTTFAKISMRIVD